MPKLSLWFIRTALIYLLLGFTIGALLLIQKGLNFYPKIWMMLPVHIEWMFIGWIFQLVMGVAFWVLPRFAQPPLRGNETIVVLSYGLLNLGILVVFCNGLLQMTVWISFAGRALEAMAVILFAAHAWPRIRAFSG